MDDFDPFESSFNLEQTHGIQIETPYSTPSLDTQNSPLDTQNSRFRGKAFSVMEDEALCRSWLAISQDPISGNSQTTTVFWERIRQCFSSQPNVEVNRMATSLSHRWSVIQKAVNKFVGFVDQVERRNQSGIGDADKATSMHLKKLIGWIQHQVGGGLASSRLACYLDLKR